MTYKNISYSCVRVKFDWVDPTGRGVDWQVRISGSNDQIIENLFSIPLGGIFGDNGEWFFEKCMQSIKNNGEIIADSSEISDFQICNGVVAVRELRWGDEEDWPRTNGVSYIDMHNIRYFCDLFYKCHIERKPQDFVVFCFHDYLANANEFPDWPF